MSPFLFFRMLPYDSKLFPDFPSRTTQSCLLLREDTTPNIWPEIPEDLILWRRPACQTMWRSLRYIKPYFSSSPRPVKSPSNSIRHNFHKICSWSRLSKTILKIRKRPHFPRCWLPIVYKFFKDFIHRKTTNKVEFFSCRTFPNILKYWNHQW